MIKVGRYYNKGRELLLLRKGDNKKGISVNKGKEEGDVKKEKRDWRMERREGKF
jgi:hypothetical protein